MNIQYICFTGCTGFATAAKNNICALMERGHDIKVAPLDLGFNKKINSRNFSKYNKIIKKDDIRNALKLYHCVPFMQRRIKTRGKKVGYATFETLNPPSEWKAFLKNYVLIIVPSMFNYNVFLEQGYNNLFYFPHIIDFSKFNPSVKPGRNEVEGFKFLWIGTWKKRKNYELLIRAFLEEFHIDENVSLVMKTDRSIQNPEISIKKIKTQLNKRHYPNIYIDQSIIDDDYMPQYIKSFDCFVSPTRGEGFGLPGLQSMALGIPIIITDWSGVKDYANTENATMLSIDGFEEVKCMDNIVQFKQKKWPIISLKELRSKMRYVFENYERCRERAENHVPDLRSRFGYGRIVELEERLKLLGEVT